GIEIMANSDNVVRAGLTSKPINTGLLRKLARLEHTEAVRPEMVTEDAVRQFRTEADEFCLELLEDGTAVVAHGPRIVLALGSDCEVVTTAERRVVPKGHAVFVRASSGTATVSSEGLTAIASVPPARR
ncbi:MAG TPA: hypothetical protein VFD20_02720, partial [Demequina sp.]|nr:hypothetical protein [Demequina sp.]